MNQPRVALVFLDGVGLGPPEATNPLARLTLPTLRHLALGQPWTSAASACRADACLFRPIDATLGVEGLPQSGTGQATLFSGVNCARAAGRHWGPFPHSSSKPILAAHSLFARVARAGRRAQLLNAYPDRFFCAAAPRQRWTVTTLMCRQAGIPLLREADLRAGRALAADLTAQGWRTLLGRDVPTTAPRRAGARAATLAREADLTLFEYYLTDKAGHAQDTDFAARVLADLDAFLEGWIEALDPARELLVVTSDHGNLEDLSTRGHTRHPVPLAAWGLGADALAEVDDLTGVTPALASLLGA